MEHLPALGTSIPETISPTRQIYQQILNERADEILSTKKETFRYGPNPRQVLDVYYPSDENNPSSPILIFFYGGGLVHGDRTLSNFEHGLVYANLGHFFSTLGYITIIPDYRLVPEAKFPNGGEDVLASLEWADSRFRGLDGDIYLMGNSAGGVHVSTFILAEKFAPERSRFLRPVGGLKGAILFSVPFSFREAHKARIETLQSYFSSDIEGNSPLGLLKAVEKSGASLPIPILVLTCALDPIDEIINPTREFSKLCERLATSETVGGIFEERVIEGHNHISPVFAVGTGKNNEEAWAVGTHEWMKSVATKN